MSDTTTIEPGPRTRAQEICSRFMMKPYIPKDDYKDLVVNEDLRRDVEARLRTVGLVMVDNYYSKFFAVRLADEIERDASISLVRELPRSRSRPSRCSWCSGRSSSSPSAPPRSAARIAGRQRAPAVPGHRRTADGHGAVDERGHPSRRAREEVRRREDAHLPRAADVASASSSTPASSASPRGRCSICSSTGSRWPSSSRTRRLWDVLGRRRARPRMPA
jgi:hypothetical protein